MFCRALCVSPSTARTGYDQHKAIGRRARLFRALPFIPSSRFTRRDTACSAYAGGGGQRDKRPIVAGPPSSGERASVWGQQPERRTQMAMPATVADAVPWWREPTKDQWLAWWAAWLGWTLDAFDFTVFLLIMVPISQEFHVPLTSVAFVLSVTLWLRLVGAVGSGWLADRVGRKIPLMMSILWYSLANFAAGFSPTFTYLFLFRALLGIG